MSIETCKVQIVNTELSPKEGEIRFGSEIDKSSQSRERFVYRACDVCETKRWIRLRSTHRKCVNCCHKKKPHDLSKEPIVGEIRYGDEIGKNTELSTKFIYRKCEDCGVKWWGSIYKQSTKCTRCCQKKPRNNSKIKPIIGEVRYGDEIGKLSGSSVRYIYRMCEECGKDWWAREDYKPARGFTKCIKCMYRKPRKNYMNNPVVGELRLGEEIGQLSNPSTPFMWASCEICGEERWVPCKKGEIIYKRCHKCRMVGIKSTKYIENRIRKIKLTKEKRCHKCGEVYPATREYFKKSASSILGIGALCIPCAKIRAHAHHNKRMQFVGARLNSSIRAGVYAGLKGNKNGRKWENIIGYKLKDLMRHLESQFKDGMSWGNYGEWHVDHVIPRSFFHFTNNTDLDFKRCWELSNLQPLWKKDNMVKNTKITKPFQPSLELQLRKEIKNNIRDKVVVGS